MLRLFFYGLSIIAQSIIRAFSYKFFQTNKYTECIVFFKRNEYMRQKNPQPYFHYEIKPLEPSKHPGQIIHQPITLFFFVLSWRMLEEQRTFHPQTFLTERQRNPTGFGEKKNWDNYCSSDHPSMGTRGIRMQGVG